MRLINIGRKIPIEQTKKRLETRRNNAIKNGFYHSPETLDKIKSGITGKRRSEEQKQRMRKPKTLTQEQRDRLSYRARFETKHYGIPIICLSLKGEFIQEYQSAASASKIMKINKNWINSVLREKAKYCKEYLFIYKKDYDSEKDYTVKITKTQQVQKLSLSGNLLNEYNTISEAAIDNNVAACNISKVCMYYEMGKYPKNTTLKGFIYKYKNYRNAISKES